MTMFVVPRDRPHSRPEFRPHRREGGEQHVRESRSEPDSLGGVSLLVHGAAPEGLGLGSGWRHEISQNRETQVIPPPAFYCINHNQTRPLQSRERETTCSVNVLKLVSPNQPDLQQLWGQSTSKPNVRVRVRVRIVGYSIA